MAEEGIISLKEFKELSKNEKKKFTKEKLMKILLNTESPDLSSLTNAIKELNKIINDFKKVQVDNSFKIVQLTVELARVKNENAELRTDFSTRINNLE